MSKKLLLACVLGVVTIACAEAIPSTSESDDDSDSKGDADSDSDSSGTGGDGSVPSGSGGTTLTGGSSGTGGGDDSCSGPPTMPCIDVHPSFPVGTTSCKDGVYPTTTCRVCNAGDLVDCSTLPFNPNPYGQASCDPDAGFGKGDWKMEECGTCEPGVTKIACTALETGNFTGGEATCGENPDEWDTSECGECGDNQKDEQEECDGTATTATTCTALGLADGPNPGAEVNSCTEACEYNTSVCSNCAAGVQADKCMETAGHCVGAACDNAGCAEGVSQCEFWCRDNIANECDAPICSSDATCKFDCYNNGGCDAPKCLAGATCNFQCQNTGGDCTNVVCEDGAACDFTCANGGFCSTAPSTKAYCKDDDECTLNCTDGGNCAGVDLVCESGSVCHLHMTNAAGTPKVDCLPGSTCHLHCLGADCSDITCSGGTCFCSSGTCPGF